MTGLAQHAARRALVELARVAAFAVVGTAAEDATRRLMRRALDRPPRDPPDYIVDDSDTEEPLR